MSDNVVEAAQPDATAPGTEVAVRPLSELTTLTLSEQFREEYEVLDPGAQVELYAELERDGIELHLGHLTRVKVPTGGITQFQITDEDNVEQAVRELRGVPLKVLDRRSMWLRNLDDAEGDKGPPDCSSRDGKTGDGLYGVGSERHPTGDCMSCPMNARGSAGTGTQASKCKAQKLMFLASTQEALPMIISIPAASLGNYTRFRVGGSIKAKRRSRGPKEIRLTLKKAKNPRGIEYAEIEFAATGREFTDDEKVVIGAFSERMDQMIKANQAALDAMANAAAAHANGGTTEFTESPGEVPFGDRSDEDGLPLDEVDTGSTRRR